MRLRRIHTSLIFSLLLLTVHAQQVLTLEQAMAIAEINSPSMQKAQLSREQSRQMLIAQKAALKASISLSVDPINYSNNRNFDSRSSDWYTNENLSSSSTFRVSQPILLTNTTVSLVNRFGWQNTSSDYNKTITTDHSFINDLYLTLRQPLFTYNKQKMDLKQLELEVENSEIEYNLNRLSLEQIVSALFYNVFMAQLNLDIASQEFNNTQASRSTTSDKVETGLAAKIELYQADLNLSSAKSTVKNREVLLQNAKAKFMQFVGMDLKSSFEVMASIGEIDSLEINMQKAIEYGLEYRMELRQRKINMENAQFTMTQIKALNEFAGSVSLSLGLVGNDEILNKMYNKPTRSPGIAVSFNIPIFDWGERKARIKAQNAVLKSRKIDFESETTQITIEIGEIFRNIENYRIQIDIEKQNQENARLAYDISLEKYKNGDLTSMDLNLYQSQLSNKKISMAQAQINYKMELLNLKIASLYDFEKNAPVILPIGIMN